MEGKPERRGAKGAGKEERRGEGLSPRDRRRLVEAVLFVGKAPVKPADLHAAFPSVTEQLFDQAIWELKLRYRRGRRPYQVVGNALAGYQIRLYPAFVDAIRSRMDADRPGIMLGRPALETLSIVAYRQPAAVADIEPMTSTDPRPVLRQLKRLQLVASERDDQGVERYVTTPRFLQAFELESIADLPSLEELG